MMKNVKLLMFESFGWHQHIEGHYELWTCGKISNFQMAFLFQKINKLDGDYENILDFFRKLIQKIKGQFAIVFFCNEFVFAASDKLSSIPLFYYHSQNKMIIGNQAVPIKEYANLKSTDTDKRAYLEIAMSGFTIGNKTIFKNLYQLCAGEFIFFSNNTLTKEYYFSYLSSSNFVSNSINLNKQFTEVLEESFSELIELSSGRQIAIPLSAGNDSRLIASGLKHLGAKDVICFSYGARNSGEVKISRAVSKKLGYKWFNVPISYKSQREFFLSDEFLSYKNIFNFLSSTPFVQDISVIKEIFNNKLISQNAIIVNGNTGDFISGGHIPKSLFKNNFKITKENLLKESWSDYLEKHYSLWGILRNRINDEYLINELTNLAKYRDKLSNDDISEIPGFFESLEFLGRQTKYIVNMQRAYEFYGYSWFMPLWSESMINFWKNVPFSSKLNQKLYKETIHENNWGGVWSEIPVNKVIIKPAFLRYSRLLCKLMIYPYSKNAWSKFERNVFAYHLDNVKNSTIVPYQKVLFDTRGQRHWLSWLTEIYLYENGMENIMELKKGIK